MILHQDRILSQARPIGYLLANGFLAQHAALQTALAMRPAKMLVYLTIITATVQKPMRDPAFPGDLQGTARMPRAMIGYISRRAIAAATGIPRENVRRIVDELLAEELLLTGPRGAVANRGGLMESERILAALQKLLHETANMAERLVQLGVLELP